MTEQPLAVTCSLLCATADQAFLHTMLPNFAAKCWDINWLRVRSMSHVYTTDVSNQSTL